jgi:rare lipoprotein A (peptidoglycan hydrolase)
VIIERYSPRQASWVRTAETSADQHGAYKASWRTNEAGRFSVRATLESPAANSAQAGHSAATAQLTVYHPALATWYGPGSYGHRTACHRRLTRALVGVASRTLPCGTQVEVSFHGRTLTVPVVDRGPYTSATWDLTAAAARALGFDGRKRIGTLVLG